MSTTFTIIQAENKALYVQLESEKNLIPKNFFLFFLGHI